MRLRETLRLLFGSTAIYVIVAACSASNGPGVADSGLDVTRIGGHDATTMKGDGAERHDAPAHDTGKKGVMDVVTHPVAEASADTNESGTRLKTQRYVGSDGSSAFLGMYDSQLKTACQYVSGLSDGSTRCIPMTPGVTAGAFFSDATCGTPLAAVSTCAPAPTYATILTPATSCSTPASVQVFAVTSAWTGLVYDGTPTACVAAPSTTIGRYSFFSLGTTEVPPSTFIAGTVTTDF